MQLPDLAFLTQGRSTTASNGYLLNKLKIRSQVLNKKYLFEPAASATESLSESRKSLFCKAFSLTLLLLYLCYINKKNIRTVCILPRKQRWVDLSDATDTAYSSPLCVVVAGGV